MQGHSVTAVDLEFLFERGSQGREALFPEAWVHSRFRNLLLLAGRVPNSDLARVLGAEDKREHVFTFLFLEEPPEAR